MLQLNPMLLGQQRTADHPEADQTESNDEGTTDSLEPDLVVAQRAAKRSRAGTQQDKHQRESTDEEYGVDQSNAAALHHLGQRHAGKKSQIAGDQGQHAGRQKAQEPCGKCDEESQRRRLAHSGPSSRCRQERHTP